MMKSHERAIWVARMALLLSLVLFAGACGGDDAEQGGDGTADPGTAAPVAVTILPASPSFVGSAFVHLPQYLGFYEEEGLDVTIIPSFEGATEDAALVAGQVDLIIGDPDVFAARILADPDFPVTCVATVQMWAFRVLVPTDSPIEEAADLAGTTIGVPDASDIETLSLMLNVAGVDPESVDAVPVGGRAPAAVAMFNGSTDAAMGTHIDQLAMEAEFGTDALRRIETMPLGSFNGCALVRTEMLENQPEVVEGMLRGLAKGATVAFEDAELTIDLIGQQHSAAWEDRDDAVALARAVQDAHGAAYEAEFLFPEEEWQGLVDSFAEAGFLESSVDITPNLDFSILENVWNFDKEAVLETARSRVES